MQSQSTLTQKREAATRLQSEIHKPTILGTVENCLTGERGNAEISGYIGKMNVRWENGGIEHLSFQDYNDSIAAGRFGPP